MPISRKPIGRKPMAQSPGGTAQQPPLVAPIPQPTMPMSMPMPAPVGPDSMPTGPVPPGSTPHGAVPFYPGAHTLGRASPMQPIQPQWAQSPTVSTPPIYAQAYSTSSSAVTPVATHSPHQAPLPCPPATFPLQASPPSATIASLPSMSTSMNLPMHPRPMSVMQPVMSAPSTMAPAASTPVAPAPAAHVHPAWFTSPPATGPTPSPAQSPAPTQAAAPVPAPAFPPTSAQTSAPTPVPGPGQLQRSVTTSSVASKSDDFSRRTSLATTIAPGSPLTTVAMPIGTRFAGTPAVGATICASCKQAIAANVSIFTCLVCSTAQLATSVCVWCYTTGAAASCHPHDISFFAADSDLQIQGQAGLAPIPANVWTIRKNASGRLWYTHNELGFKTHLQPVPALDDDNADSSALPFGWQEMKTPDGKVYYLNSASNTTSWERPVKANSLPLGWRTIRTPDGVPFYVHDRFQLSTWERPGEQPQPRVVQRGVAAVPGTAITVSKSKKVAKPGMSASDVNTAVSVANNMAKLSAASDLSASGIYTATVAAAKLTGLGMKIAGKKMGKLGKGKRLSTTVNLIGAAARVADNLDGFGEDCDDEEAFQIEEVDETEDATDPTTEDPSAAIATQDPYAPQPQQEPYTGQPFPEQQPYFLEQQGPVFSPAQVEPMQPLQPWGYPEQQFVYDPQQPPLQEPYTIPAEQAIDPQQPSQQSILPAQPEYQSMPAAQQQEYPGTAALPSQPAIGQYPYETFTPTAAPESAKLDPVVVNNNLLVIEDNATAAVAVQNSKITGSNQAADTDPFTQSNQIAEDNAADPEIQIIQNAVVAVNELVEQNPSSEDVPPAQPENQPQCTPVQEQPVQVVDPPPNSVQPSASPPDSMPGPGTVQLQTDVSMSDGCGTPQYITSQYPIAPPQPNAFQQPIAPQQAAAAQQSTAAQQYIAHQQPTTSQQPVAAQQSNTLHQPITAHQPIAPQQPNALQQSITPQQPITSQQPIASQQPIVPQRHVTPQQPMTAQQLTASQQIIAFQQPMPAQQYQFQYHDYSILNGP